MSAGRLTIFLGLLGFAPGAFAGFALHEGRALATGKQVAFAVSRPQVTVPAEIVATHDKRQFLNHARFQLVPQFAYRDVPKACVQALLAWEDARFFSHHGLDWVALARAGAAYVSGRHLQGGSTITQQLTKTKFLQAERHGFEGIQRKLRELILAPRLEREMSKEAIIESYFSSVYLGTVQGTELVGLHQAATFYFGKNGSELNRYECAVLVGSLASPNTRNYKVHPELAHQYAAKVIAKTVARKFISAREGDIALRTRSKPGRLEFAEPDARHFLSALADEVFRLGAMGGVGDLRLVVGIDYRDQLLGENLVCRMTHSRGTPDFQAALVGVTTSGEIRALVGGCDFASSPFNRVTQAKRQPGSAFKPFVYTSAMQAGLSPRTIRNDLPLNFDGWQPENFDHTFRGPISLQTAFADSVNTVSVRLTLEVGVAKVIQTARALGITSDIKPNVTIGLGTAEVSLLELTQSFIPFASNGHRVKAHSALMMISSGRVIFQDSGQTGPIVLSRRVQADMRQLFEAVIKYGTGKLAGPDACGGKTGTSQGQRDAWFIGWRCEDSLMIGIWAGSDSNSPIAGLTGGGLPAATWRHFAALATHEQSKTSAVPHLPMTELIPFPPLPPDAKTACRHYPNLC
jgi:penicillin-binding protein 1A